MSGKSYTIGDFAVSQPSQILTTYGIQNRTAYRRSSGMVGDSVNLTGRRRISV